MLLAKIGDDYFPLGAQWDIKNQVWRAYQVGWWTRSLPRRQRDTSNQTALRRQPLTKQVTEWNVGCEKCHGPGDAHAKAPSRGNIVNPAHLDSFDVTDTCVQCQPQCDNSSMVNPSLPAALALKDFWKLEEPRLGASATKSHARQRPRPEPHLHARCDLRRQSRCSQHARTTPPLAGPQTRASYRAVNG